MTGQWEKERKTKLDVKMKMYEKKQKLKWKDMFDISLLLLLFLLLLLRKFMEFPRFFLDICHFIACSIVLTQFYGFACKKKRRFLSIIYVMYDNGIECESDFAKMCKTDTYYGVVCTYMCITHQYHYQKYTYIRHMYF